MTPVEMETLDACAADTVALREALLRIADLSKTLSEIEPAEEGAMLRAKVQMPGQDRWLHLPVSSLEVTARLRVEMQARLRDARALARRLAANLQALEGEAE